MWRSVLEFQEASIDLDAVDGDATVVAAPGANRRIVLESYVFITDTDVEIRWKSGSTNKTGKMQPGANGGAEAHVPISCGTNEALILNTSAAATVGGHLNYRVEELIS